MKSFLAFFFFWYSNLKVFFFFEVREISKLTSSQWTGWLLKIIEAYKENVEDSLSEKQK